MKRAKRIRNLLLAGWIVLAAGLVLHIVLRNVPPDGRLLVSAEPGRPSAFFGGFRPEQRIAVIPGSYAVLEGEPIYFAMAVPAFFHRATVRMEYLNEGQPKVELGGRASLDEWRFDLKPLKTVATEGDWKTGEASFDLGPLAVDGRGEVQMVVSIPDMQNGNAAPVKVRRVDILYEREPLSFGSVMKAIRDRL